MRQCLSLAGVLLSAGYVALVSLANFLVVPFANFGLSVSGSPLLIPSLDLSEMMPVLLGMLGLGGLRTYEKTKNVARK